MADSYSRRRDRSPVIGRHLGPKPRKKAGGKSLERVNRHVAASRTGPWQLVDPVVFFTALALVAYGCLVIWTASLTTSEASFPRHLAGVAIGAVCAGLVWRSDYRQLANYTQLLLAIDIVLVFLPYVPFLSYNAKGLTGWIKIPLIGLTFQPAEASKVITILFMASLMAQYNGRISELKEYLRVCGLLAVPFAAVVLQGDLGSGLVVLFAGAVIVVAGGAKREWVLATVGVMVGLVALVLASDALVDRLVGDAHSLIKQYQMNRLLVFINPDADTSGAGYNLKQSMIAVGSGGLLGKGIGNATQSSSGFLPEHHTDFVFALLSEEFGFVGALLLLVLLGLLMLGTLRIAAKTESVFGKLVAIGIAGMWMFQVFENIGMCIGLMPITGIPLPFISFGSSSMIVQLSTVGLVQSIWRHRSKAA